MTPTPARDRKITFRRATITQNNLGNETETIADLVAAWAAVKFGTGEERRDAASALAVQAATFRVLSTIVIRTVTPRDKITFDGAEWGIKSIAPVGPQGMEIEFAAIRLGAA